MIPSIHKLFSLGRVGKTLTNAEVHHCQGMAALEMKTLCLGRVWLQSRSCQCRLLKLDYHARNVTHLCLKGQHALKVRRSRRQLSLQPNWFLKTKF